MTGHRASLTNLVPRGVSSIRLRTASSLAAVSASFSGIDKLIATRREALKCVVYSSLWTIHIYIGWEDMNTSASWAARYDVRRPPLEAMRIVALKYALLRLSTYRLRRAVVLARVVSPSGSESQRDLYKEREMISQRPEVARLQDHGARANISMILCRITLRGSRR